MLVQLQSLGERQWELVREGRMTELLDVLGLKQRVLLQLQAVERELDPFRGEEPDARPWRSPEARRRCREQLAECESILAAIVEQEKKSECELTRRRDEAARRLSGMHTAAEARSAYRAPSGGAPGRLNLQS